MKEKLTKAIYEQVNFQEKKEIISEWKASIVANRVLSELKKTTIEDILDFLDNRFERVREDY